MDPKEIRQLLGLPEDASDEQVREKLKAQEGEEPTEPSGPDEPSETPGEETPAEEPSKETPEEGGTPEETPEATPEGAVPVDAKALAELRRKAEAGERAERRQLKAEEDTLIEGAIKAGKFPRSSEQHYRKLLAADREGTKKLLAELEPGIIPVDREELGEPSSGEEIAAGEAYPKSWLPELGGRDGRVTQEVV